MRNIMVSWVGNNDLKSIEKKKLTGPVNALLNSKNGKEFDEIYLLCNYAKDLSEKYFKMLGKVFNFEYKYISENLLNSPMNYTLIYEEVIKFLNYIENLKEDKEIKWHFHTSPGTQAMSAVWVLLGKTKYNAKLFYSWCDKNIERVEEAKIPFDISIDYLPDLYRQREKKILENWNTIPAFEDIIYSSKLMNDTLNKASYIAKYNVPVLLLGETGTGKELFARGIHNDSNRKKMPFEAINCGAIPENLLETTLFGWSKGAYTGAVGEDQGLFLKCNGGSLFLDEIGELSLNLQVKLLRVLQENQVMRVGDNKKFDIDVRIIAATNKDLTEMVVNNEFREDLFHRIGIGIIKIPALRERGGDDILKIAKFFLTEINKNFSEPFIVNNLEVDNSYIKKEFSVSAIKELINYNWPGNVRELYNSIVRACLWSKSEKIDAEDIRESIIKFEKKEIDTTTVEIPENGVDLKNILFDMEKEYYKKALSMTRSKREAAELLNINPKTFEKRCRTQFNL